MHIANPIYDVVFKCMMSDNKIAKLFISAIIDQEVLELDFKPQEHIGELKKENKKGKKNKEEKTESTFTIYRLDFSAKIKTPDGSKHVIIELQKAKFQSDIVRFRKYLGGAYSNTDDVVYENGNKVGIPIINIYFLGHKLENIQGVPVLKVARQYLDVVNQRVIEQKDSFVESLSHDSYIVSIADLTPKRRTELESLLSIFDQNSATDNTNHILNVKEEDFPEKFRPIIRKLQQANEEKKVRDTMDIEDEILAEFQEIERRRAEQDKVIEEKTQIIAEKDKALEEKDKALEENAKALEDKDKALEDKDKALEDKDKALEDKDKALEDKDKALEEKERAIQQQAQILERALAELEKIKANR